MFNNLIRSAIKRRTEARCDRVMRLEKELAKEYAWIFRCSVARGYMDIGEDDAALRVIFKTDLNNEQQVFFLERLVSIRTLAMTCPKTTIINDYFEDKINND